jgi:purine-binding chemotaxis protein CheW
MSADVKDSGPKTRVDPDERIQLATFVVGEAILGIDLMRVREIVRGVRASPVPGAPTGMSGIVNLRGKVLSVFDLRPRFGVPAGSDREPHVLIVELDGRRVGIAVDEVKEAVAVARRDLRFGAGVLSGEAGRIFVGIWPRPDRPVLLLDLRRALEGSEPLSLAAVGARPATGDRARS